MADQEATVAKETNQINPNAGPMRVDGEIIFRQEWDGMVQKLPFNTDSYKPPMEGQYPPEVDVVNSYVESRGTDYPEDLMVFAGSQPWVNAAEEGINMRDVNMAREMWAAHGIPFPYDMWKSVVVDHGGRLPLHIRAIPEGTVLPSRNVLATVHNLGGRPTRGLTTWAETTYLSSIWYMSSVATESWHIKKLISSYYEQSVADGVNDPSLLFRLHDFGFRGVAPGAAGAGGGAHMIAGFMGTDTYAAIPFLVRNYRADPAMVGYSIPAMEHSTVTSWGRENEYRSFDNMTDLYAGEGKLYAMVIDSYDAEAAVRYITDPNGHIVKTLKEKGGICVLRPDSGDPVALLSKLIQIVAKNVGYTTNSKDYKILNHFRFIWGDGINRLNIETILRNLVGVMGFSAENFAFGMGGALLQKQDRDRLQFAMKCSAVQLNDGSWRNVYKQPAGVISKNSKQGLVETFVSADGDLYVRDIRDSKSITDHNLTPLMEDVFSMGQVMRRWTLAEARENAQLDRVYLNALQGHSAGVYAPMV
jgi:nicotinamide phosphoribosyltransferase